VSRQVLIADSTQISAFLECPEYYNLKHKQNLGLDTEVDEPIMAGTFGHKLLDIYYANLHLGVDKAVELAQSFEPPIEFNLSLDLISLIRGRFNLYWMTYSRKDIVPLTKRIHKIEFKWIGPFIAKNSREYPIDRYPNVALVEQGFSYELLNTSEYLFVLEGRIDLIGEINGTKLWADHKFQFRKRDLYNKSIQFRNYSLVTDLSMGIINYIRLHKETSKDTLKRDLVTFSPAERRHWKQELTEIFIKMVKTIKSGSFERNRDSCPGKFGYKCEFTPICDEYDPLIQVEIKKRYKEIPVWKPW
jgi:hypothetical protein